VKKVIILMSTYNGEKYIREQIESILTQTYKNIELFVRDDGSKDSTTKILEEYARAGKLTWFQGENLKPARSFLELVKKAPEAEYYAFADQDDVWDSDKIEVAVNMLSNVPNEKPALYCSATRLVDENLNVITPIAHCKNFKLTFGEALVQAISPGCTFVFNRKSKEYLDMFKSEYISMHDALLMLIATAFGNVIFDKQPHISYRQHSNNVIGTQHSLVSRYKRRLKRFLFSKDTNSRYKMACAFEQSFKDLMTEQDLVLLRVLTNYKKSLFSRMRLAFNKEIRMVDKLDNFFLFILALLGRI
jgi:glycosyltransferase involved in cell wall biosynthesis